MRICQKTEQYGPRGLIILTIQLSNKTEKYSFQHYKVSKTVSILKNNNNSAVVIIPPDPKLRRYVHWALRRRKPTFFQIKTRPRDESPIMWRPFGGRVYRPKIETTVHDLHEENNFCPSSVPWEWLEAEDD